MYDRRRPVQGGVRLIAGLLIIAVVVIVFIGYQTQQSSTPLAQPLIQTGSPSVALVVTALSTPSVTETPKPIETRIISAKANLSAVVTELYYAVGSDNWDLTHLGIYAGHLEGTAALGHGGNFVLAGHVELHDGSQGPFALINQLAKGDPITLIGDTQPRATIYQYVVTDVAKVSPQDFDVLRNHGYEELTLITCDDWNQTAQTYASRIIVHARPVGSPLANKPAATATRKK